MKKKYRSLFLWLTMVIILWKQTVPAYASEPDLYALSAVLIDADSGRVLYGKEETVPRAMASTTKIMTAILILENCDLEETAVVSAYAAGMPKVKLYAKAGETYRVKDLLYSMMLESHNDSAQILAEHAGGKLDKQQPGKAFAAMMNRKAAGLGLEDTWFITPNGLDATETLADTGEERAHETTAVSLARLLRYCILESPEREAFLRITRTGEYGFTANGRTFRCYNRNALLQTMPGALSGKTGFTGKAGYCYVGAVERGEKRFIAALLGCGWPNNRNYKWKDMQKLIAYGEENFHKIYTRDYLLQEASLPRVKVTDGVKEEVPVLFAECETDWQESSFLVREEESVTADVQLCRELVAPVEQGQRIGEITYRIGEEIIGRVPLAASEGVPKKDFWWYLKKIAIRTLRVAFFMVYYLQNNHGGIWFSD